MEPTVLVANVPSFSLFLLKRGFRAWPSVVTKLLLERSKYPARERGSGPPPTDARFPSPPRFREGWRACAAARESAALAPRENRRPSDQSDRGAIPGDSRVS